MVVASRPSPVAGPAAWDDAVALAATGDDVTLVVTDDVVHELVLAPRWAAACRDAGVRLLVDERAARRRAVADLLPGDVPTAPTTDLARLLVDADVTTVWR